MRDFIDVAAKELDMQIRWKGNGLDEVGIVAGRANPIVRVDPRYFRPTEVDSLVGDPRKAREKLGWVARTRFEDLVAEMIREDLKAAERDALVKRHGYMTYDFNE